MGNRIDNQYNLEPDGTPDPDLQDKVGGTYGLVNSIFKVIGFFAFLLTKTITDLINVFSKKD